MASHEIFETNRRPELKSKDGNKDDLKPYLIIDIVNVTCGHDRKK